MNYRHIYHAGNFADAFKHLVLISILNNLIKKDKPFAVLDCFAGIGLYDLHSLESLKTLESNNGIKKFIEVCKNQSMPGLVKKLLEITAKTNNFNNQNIIFYPGSPLIIKNFIQMRDRLIACELHPKDYESLKKLFYSECNVQVHHVDAYSAIKAFMPFRENRGLVFIDPPFEVTNEFDKIIHALNILKKRASNIPIIIWYPIKNTRIVEEFYNQCQKIKFKEIINIEAIADNSSKNMNKCGMMIINPPDIKQELEENFGFIASKIYNNKVSFTINIWNY